MAEKEQHPKFHSSPKQIRDFIEFSPVWKDIREELITWLGNAHMLLENPDCVLSHQQIDQISGRARTLREAIKLPEVLLETMEIKKH